MNHQDIAQLVKSMDIKPLTEKTFGEFVQNAKGLFMPSGARFQRMYSIGLNDMSKKNYDFSKEKPEYQQGEVDIFERTEEREIPEKVQKWINIWLRNEPERFSFAEVWGIPHSRRKLPLKFGFNANRAIYIAEEEGNGTPEMPYETVFLKL